MSETDGFNPEQQYYQDLRSQYYDLAGQLAEFYQMPEILENHGLAFRADPRHRVERYDMLKAPATPKGDFEFDTIDYSCLDEEFNEFFEFVISDEPTRRHIARTIYMGVGISKYIVEQHLSDRRVPSTTTRRKAIYKIFSDRTDIEELFQTITDGGHQAMMSQYLLDADIMQANGFRIGLRYLFDACPSILEPHDLVTVCEAAKQALHNIIQLQSPQYVDISVFGFNRTIEQGEKTFIYKIPSWLLALAAQPMPPGRLKHLHNPDWQRQEKNGL